MNLAQRLAVYSTGRPTTFSDRDAPVASLWYVPATTPCLLTASSIIDCESSTPSRVNANAPSGSQSAACDSAGAAATNTLFYSFDGLKAAYRHEDAFRQESWLALVLIPLALFLPASGIGHALMVGSVQQVIDKILYEHELFGQTRFLAQASIGTVPHPQILRSIELFGTKVAPAVRKALGK